MTSSGRYSSPLGLAPRLVIHERRLRVSETYAVMPGNSGAEPRAGDIVASLRQILEALGTALASQAPHHDLGATFEQHVRQALDLRAVRLRVSPLFLVMCRSCLIERPVVVSSRRYDPPAAAARRFRTRTRHDDDVRKWLDKNRRSRSLERWTRTNAASTRR